MGNGQLYGVIRHLRRVVGPRDGTDLSDARLLERFVTNRDAAAFELLLWRHGGLVLGVCRRVLGHAEDAEDAFQATFLTLARKAGSIRRGVSVGGWLYRVAYRVALAARAARRARRERPLDAAPEPVREAVSPDDLGPVLDQEVQRLPEKYRVPVVLCYLEGKTVDQAAAELGCPRGTVGVRLSRARARLRQRLVRRGVTPWAAVATALLAEQVEAVTPAEVASTLKAALGYAAGPAAAIGVSPAVAALTEGVVRTMAMNKLKVLAAVLAVAVLAAGVGYALQAKSDSPNISLALKPPEKGDGAKPEEKPAAAKHPAAHLPSGPLPMGGWARLENNDRLSVTAVVTAYRWVLDPQGRTSYQPAISYYPQVYDLERVGVFGTDGKPIDPKNLARLLGKGKEGPVLVGFEPPDPFYLRLLKEGTLILVVPTAVDMPLAPLPPGPAREERR